MPISLPTTRNVSIDTYSMVDNFTFICNSYVKGLLPTTEETKIGALEFLLYPMDENPVDRKTSIFNKPARLLIRGSAEPIEMINSNPNLEIFTQNYPIPKGETVQNTFQGIEVSRNIYIEPRLNILKDNFKISVIVCTGYSRVAGQSLITPTQLEYNENITKKATNNKINNNQTEEANNE